MRKQPNILFLFTDQHRLDSLGCYGNSICQTPNLDALAQRGVRFNHAYTPTSICTPARASLLTGVKPYRHKLLANFERNVGYMTELPDGTIPFSRYLRDAGYNVGTVGKWHIGMERGPDFYGFDGSHYPGWGPPIQHPEYTAYLRQNGFPSFEVRNPVRGTFPNGQPSNVLGGLYDGPAEGLFDAFITDRTVQQLHHYAAEDRPFFLASQWFGPHLPYFLPPRYYNLYAPDQIPLPATMMDDLATKPRVHRHYAAHWTFDSFTPADWQRLIAAYWGYVTLLDEQVGRIVAALEELGLREDTIIVFSSDHGAFVGSHRMQDKGPAMYDDTYRVPLIIDMPQGRANAQEDRFVSLIDLTASFLDWADVDVPDYFDGSALTPLLQADNPPSDLAWRDFITAEFHGHHFPYPQRMIRTHKHKLVVNPPDIDELYDLTQDPLEMTNQIDNPDYAAIRDQLYARLYDELRQGSDNFHHWMTSMYKVGAAAGDASLSQYKF